MFGTADSLVIQCMWILQFKTDLGRTIFPCKRSGEYECPVAHVNIHAPILHYRIGRLFFFVFDYWWHNMVVVVCGGQGIFNSTHVHVLLFMLRNAGFGSKSWTDYALLSVEGKIILHVNTDGTV